MFDLFSPPRFRVVAPSAPCATGDAQQRALRRGIDTLESVGAVVTQGRNARCASGYVSAPTAARLSDFEDAYLDPEVDVLIAGTGGWNASHLLAGFPYALAREYPKPLLGFSDISLLQTGIYARTERRQLHSPMLRWGIPDATPFTLSSLQAAVEGRGQTLPLRRFGRFLRGDRMAGTAVCGNLVSLSTLLGTPYAPDWRGKVLLWEETEETGFRLDRALTHFGNAGVFDDLAGMVVGELDRIDCAYGGLAVDPLDIVMERVSAWDFPVMKTDLFGHPTGVDFLTVPTGGRFEADGATVLVSG